MYTRGKTGFRQNFNVLAGRLAGLSPTVKPGRTNFLDAALVERLALGLQFNQGEGRNAMPLPADHDARIMARARKPARILVVDDETHVRSMIGVALERQGYDVQLARSGREAIELVERNTFDLVLADIVMQDGNGIHLLDI